MTARQDPDVAEWLRGKAQMHRRAAATYSRTEQKPEAEISRRVAAELVDLAEQLDAYNAAAEAAWEALR